MRHRVLCVSFASFAVKCYLSSSFRSERNAMWSLRKKLEIPGPEQCLPGRAIKMRAPDQHFVNGHRLDAPYPAGLKEAVFGMGCFWGAQRKFCGAPGALATTVAECRGADPDSRS